MDRYAKSDDPADKQIYTQCGNILDFGGAINNAYQIGLYPSLVLVNTEGKVVLKDFGTKVRPEVFGKYLKTKFSTLLD